MAAFLNNPFLFLLKCSLLTLIVVRGASDSDHARCEFDHYYDTTVGQCKKCSSCSSNHMTIKPCSKFSDVECRFFTLKKVSTSKTGTSGSEYKFRSTSFKSGNGAGSKSGSGDDSLAPVNSELNEEEDNYWKTLAFALIGLLSVLIITTFIILIFVFKKLQKSIVITQTEEADLMDDADSGYVVIRAIHHMAPPRSDNHPFLSLLPRDQQTTEGQPPPPPVYLTSTGPTSIDSGRPTDSFSMSSPSPAEDNDNDSDSKSCFLPKTYQPQRRLLNYDADDVFESDDNSSSVSNHRLVAIPQEPLQVV